MVLRHQFFMKRVTRDLSLSFFCEKQPVSVKAKSNPSAIGFSK